MAVYIIVSMMHGHTNIKLLESVHLYDLERDRKINMVLTFTDFEPSMKTKLAQDRIFTMGFGIKRVEHSSSATEYQR